MDLYDFATLCKNNITINAITLSASQLLSSLDKIIIANSILGDNVKNAHGISIYFPLERPDAETMEMYSKLDFTLKYNYWFKLITSFHKPKALKRD